MLSNCDNHCRICKEFYLRRDLKKKMTENLVFKRRKTLTTYWKKKVISRQSQQSPFVPFPLCGHCLQASFIIVFFNHHCPMVKPFEQSFCSSRRHAEHIILITIAIKVNKSLVALKTGRLSEGLLFIKTLPLFFFHNHQDLTLKSFQFRKTMEWYVWLYSNLRV
jgi:hypothetical protein